jgi:type III pantothenate kinase
MTFLVGDIGNTLTKICLINFNFKIIKSFSIETNKLNKTNYQNIFFNKILKYKVNKKILFSSVVPLIYKVIKKNLSKKKYKIFELKNLKISKIVTLNVNKINQVGSDRIANAIGAYEYYKNNCLVIDFGTATTFDIISKKGIYEGGVIAPGVNLSIMNLNKFTASLPILKLRSNAKSYGKNTKDALNAGFIWGYQGLINNIIKKITLTRKTNYKIILTGGYASLFKKYLINKPIVDQNITIKGITRIYKELLE